MPPKTPSRTVSISTIDRAGTVLNRGRGEKEKHRMFLSERECRRRWLRRIMKWTTAAVLAFSVEIALAMLLLNL